MDDRALLEMAAKAAGLEFDDGRQINPTYYLVREAGSTSQDDWRAWNPLRSDGDAFRLAVKLKINIHNAAHSPGGIEFIYAQRNGERPCQEYNLDDQYVASRRAIVRAAAAIGEGMG